MPLLDPPDEVIVEEGMSDDDEEQLDHASAPQQHKAARKTSKPAKQRSKGVVYISRIPPHLKPQKLRQLLEVHGEVGRLYLAPEMQSLRAKRKKHKGNTGKNFTEGWVEFEDKRVAKTVAQILNKQQMGGKRRSAYHYDLWCLKYLPKFKWEALTEEIAYQRAVHDQKLAHEISAAKRERDFYLSRVDKAKGIAAIKERRQQQAAGAASGTTSASAAPATKPTVLPDAAPKRMRGFGQRKAKAEAGSGDAPALPPDLLRLIGGIAPT